MSARESAATGIRVARLRREAMIADQREDFGGGFGDVGAGPVDRGNPGALQKIVVLGRDDAAADDENVSRISRRNASISAGMRVLCPAAWVETPTMWTSFSTAWAGGFLRGLEQGSDVDVEADIGKGGRNDLGAAVMADQ